MGLLSLSRIEPHVLLFKIFSSAPHLTPSLMASLMPWNRSRKLLRGRTPGNVTHRFVDSQVVLEFRSKLKQVEDLVGKLAFSLEELRELPGLHEEEKRESTTFNEAMPRQNVRPLR